MKGLPSGDDFVNEVDNFIKEVKIKEEERVSYMTYEMKMREAHDDGREEMAISMAIKMLRKNKPLEEIMEFTELTKERIEELAAQTQAEHWFFQ